jgi:hypothetical protein
MTKLVSVYYNDVFISVQEKEPHEIYEGCPYVNVNIDDADNFAKDKMENGEWDAFLIPELITDKKIIYYETK